MADNRSADEQALDSWVTRLAQSWHPGRLAECVRELPDLGQPLRRTALVELIKGDLARQWPAGRRVLVEDYLREYTELAGDDRLLRQLLNAELQVRKAAGQPLKKDELARRFPKLAAEIDRSSATPSTGSAGEVTSGGGALAPRGILELPERFGKYRIRGRLGQGGMGAVFLAFDTELERLVALKVPLADAELSAEGQARFLREVRAAARLRHPNICPLYEVGAIDGRPYFTMPLIQGQTLAAQLESGPRPDPRRAAEVARKVALAVDFAHVQGLLHRDLKPANVMIDEHGEPQVMDFGLARGTGADEPRLTRSGAVVGTPAYMSPEQVKNEPVGPASDQFSLGVVLYELLTGKRPFQGAGTAVFIQIFTEDPTPPRQLRLELDPALEAICLQAMAKDPAQRHGSIQALAETLARWLAVPIATGKQRDKRMQDLTGALGRWLAGLIAPGKHEPPRVIPAAPVPPVKWEPELLSFPLTADQARDYQQRWAKYLGIPVLHTNKLGMKSAFIPPGTFLMGSPPREEGRIDDEIQHQVTLTRGYYLAGTPVTQAQWQQVMGKNPSRFKGDNRPVETVSWDDCQVFCEKLSRQEGKTHRLPTEAEWEYACRAGTVTAYCSGDGLDALKKVGWCSYNGDWGSVGETRTVGSFSPNAWGLHDTHGNVWEWCADWYGPYPTRNIESNKCTNTSDRRVLRGGSWGNGAAGCRAAARGRSAPDHRYGGIGFRVCFSLE